MPLPVTFATLAAGDQPLSLLDQQFNTVAGFGVIPCACSGTNVLTLTPFTGTPTISSYPDLAPTFQFVAAASSTAQVTINVNGVGARNAYKTNGLNACGSGDLVIGGIYRATPLQALNGGLGGFAVDAVGFANTAADISFFIDGGGAPITTGLKGWIRIPFPTIISVWSLVADQSGSITVDILRTNAGFPSTSIVGGGTKPNLSSQQFLQSGTVGWTAIALAANDFIGFNVTAAATLTKCLIVLETFKQ